MHLPEGLPDSLASTWADIAHQATTPRQPGARLLIAAEPASLRDACLEALAAALPDRAHMVLDLSGQAVTSLATTLADKLKDLPLAPADRVLHILHAETSILHGWLHQQPVWVDQLAAEAEALRQAPAGMLVCWTDAFAAAHISAQAGDLFTGTWHLLPETPPPSTTAYPRLQEIITQRQAAADPDSQGPLDLAIGEALMDFGLDEWAMPYFQAATAAPEPATQAAAQSGLGLLHLRAGQHEAARTTLELAQQLAGESAPLAVRGRIAARLGDLALGQRLYQEAQPHYRTALALYQSEGEVEDLLHVYRNLARAFEGQGKLDKAVATYQTLAGLTGLSPALAAATQQQIGAIRQNQQRWPEALAAFETALPLAQAAGDDFLIHALEDSIEDMSERAAKSPAATSPKKKGWLGRLFGG